MANSSRIIKLTGEDFKRGMASGLFASDGLFDPDNSYGIDITNVPGVLYPQQPSLDVSNSSSGRIILKARGGGPFGASPNTLLVSDTGKMFLATETGISTNYQDSANTYNEVLGDAIYYKGYFYVTSQQNIARLHASSYTFIDSATPSWWTGLGYTSLDQFAFHPMVIFEDILWIADGYKLHKFDGTTVTYNAFSLTDDQQITSLHVDPGSGRLIIATTQGVNNSGGLPRLNKVNFWDGYSNKVLRSVIVDDVVTAMVSSGGTVYMFYNYSMGYWNGSGISWLKTFYETKKYSLLITKHKIDFNGNVLYVVDGLSVLSYQAPLGTLEKRWIKVWRISQSMDQDIYSRQISNLAIVGHNIFAISYYAVSGINSGYKTFIHDFGKVIRGNTGSSYPAISFRTVVISANNAVRIKKIKLFFADPVESGVSPYGIGAVSPDSNKNTYFNPVYNNLANSKTVNSLEYLPKYGAELWLEDFYLYIFTGYTTAASYGIRKVLIYLDDSPDTI